MQMNNVYPPWWDTTVTIYNKHEDKQTNMVTWYRTVVEGAFWKYIGNKVTVGDTTLQSDNTICRIREDSRFLEPFEWQALGNDERDEYFTLAGGDIIIKGEVSDTISEYTKGQRSTDIVAKYKKLQGCMEIEQVTIDTGNVLNSEHYHVIGK